MHITTKPDSLQIQLDPRMRSLQLDALGVRITLDRQAFELSHKVCEVEEKSEREIVCNLDLEEDELPYQSGYKATVFDLHDIPRFQPISQAFLLN